MGHNLKNNHFPSSELSEEDPTYHRCMSFGEATSACPANGLNVVQIFKSFYNGFTRNAIVWFAYNNGHDYELPIIFNFAEMCEDHADLFKIMISSVILPVSFHRDRNRLQSSEFYHPSVVARQLRFG